MKACGWDTPRRNLCLAMVNHGEPRIPGSPGSLEISESPGPDARAEIDPDRLLKGVGFHHRAVGGI